MCGCLTRKSKPTSTIHAQGFPTARTTRFSDSGRPLPEYGMLGVGKGKDSAGSNHIIDVVDRSDDRPVWVTAWGGANCLAQALWKVRQTRSPSELDKFISKIRVYTISDQDDGSLDAKRVPQTLLCRQPRKRRRFRIQSSYLDRNFW